MATRKSSTKGSAKATSKAAVAPPPPTVSIQDATRLLQAAVRRATDTKRLPPRLRGPIFVGIWYNPISKQFEIVNQFE